MRMFNDFILAELEPEDTKLGNGLSVKETRGKRDIVCGIVNHTPDGVALEVGDKIMFPLYAANSLTINGKEHVVVSFKDIIMKI